MREKKLNLIIDTSLKNTLRNYDLYFIGDKTLVFDNLVNYIYNSSITPECFVFSKKSKCIILYSSFRKTILENYNEIKNVNSFLEVGSFFIITISDDKDISLLGLCLYMQFVVVLNFEDYDGVKFYILKKAEDMEKPFKKYGLLIHLDRIGQGGKSIQITKFRTMYPYSEYIQKYLYGQHGLNDKGKISQDPRVTSIGKIMRKYWIDELPQLFYIMKGKCKIIGVRLVGKAYLDLLPEKLVNMRKQVKPGLIPCYYISKNRDMNSIIKAELEYLELYKNHPIKTDFKYFIKIVVNIVFGMRSN